METLKNKLTEELNRLETTSYGEPRAKIWVDQSSLYWAVDDETFLFLADHRGIDEYLDERHKTEELSYVPEGVGHEGVYWDNMDFENPFVLSDFEERIETVNV